MFSFFTGSIYLDDKNRQHLIQGKLSVACHEVQEGYVYCSQGDDGNIHAIKPDGKTRNFNHLLDEANLVRQCPSTQQDQIDLCVKSGMSEGSSLQFLLQLDE